MTTPLIVALEFDLHKCKQAAARCKASACTSFAKVALFNSDVITQQQHLNAIVVFNQMAKVYDDEVSRIEDDLYILKSAEYHQIV